jgi:hypothetical protein
VWAEQEVVFPANLSDGINFSLRDFISRRVHNMRCCCGPIRNSATRKRREPDILRAFTACLAACSFSCFFVLRPHHSELLRRMSSASSPAPSVDAAHRAKVLARLDAIESRVVRVLEELVSIRTELGAGAGTGASGAVTDAAVTKKHSASGLPAAPAPPPVAAQVVSAGSGAASASVYANLPAPPAAAPAPPRFGPPSSAAAPPPPAVVAPAPPPAAVAPSAYAAPPFAAAVPPPVAAATAPVAAAPVSKASRTNMVTKSMAKENWSGLILQPINCSLTCLFRFPSKDLSNSGGTFGNRNGPQLLLVSKPSGPESRAVSLSAVSPVGKVHRCPFHIVVFERMGHLRFFFSCIASRSPP